MLSRVKGVASMTPVELGMLAPHPHSFLGVPQSRVILKPFVPS